MQWKHLNIQAIIILEVPLIASKCRRLALAGFLLISTLQAQTTFEVRPGQYLWHVWVSPAYQQHYPDWKLFCEETARLNGLPDADQSYREMPDGFLLKLPTLPGEWETAEKNVRGKVEKEVTENFAKEKAEVQRRIKELEARQKSADPEVVWNWWTMVFAIAASALLYLFITARGKLNSARDENRALREEVNSLRIYREISEFFLAKYAVPFKLPKDIGTVLELGDTLYIQKMHEPLEGEEGVYFRKRGALVPVKSKNLKRYFDEAAKEYDEGYTDTLEYYGVKRVKKSNPKRETVVLTT